jgi:uncharacterized Zn finger protein
VDPCVHALGVLYQLTWLLEADPFVLLRLRGLTRDDLLARLHARANARAKAGGSGDGTGTDAGPGADDVETALDAALRAARLLDLLDDPDRPVDHLF